MFLKATPCGYTQIGSGALVSAQNVTVLSAGTGVALRNANFAVITAESQSLRWRDDGTAPTASVGNLIVTGTAPFEYFGNLSGLQLIGAAGGAIANISQYYV